MAGGRVFLILGDDPYLKERQLKRLRQELVPPENKEFNFDRYHLSESTLDRVREGIEQFPFLSPHRTIEIFEIEALADKDLGQLIDVLETEVSRGTNQIILVGKQLDNRRKTSQKLKAISEVFECKRPFESHVPRWIQTMVKEEGLSISIDLVQVLHFKVGNHLESLWSEIQKLKTYMGERKQIRREDLEAIVSESKEIPVFELSRFLAEKNLKDALLSCQRSLDNGESPVLMLSLLGRHFRILLQMNTLKSLHLSDKELSQRVGVPVFFLPQYREQLRHWSQSELMTGIETLYDADIRSKTTAASKDLLLEATILDLL